MAKPNKKMPEKTVSISCAKCKAKLYKYKKGGTGSLIKCFQERITQDFTAQKGVCPECNTIFAREAIIRGVPALKMIGNKVQVK